MESTNNQYILQWKEHVLKAAEALKNKDYETYDSELGAMESVVDEMRKDEQLSYSDESSFGVANEMFESVLPTLFVKNKSAVKDIINTLKEDKNLISQFMFYGSLKQYKKDFDLHKYLNEAIELTLKNINSKTVRESNQKFYNVLRKHNIKAANALNEDNIKFYNLCDIIFTSPKSLTNMGKLNESINKIAKYVEKHAKTIVESNDKDTLTVKEFVENCNQNLTEAEKDFVNTLINSSDDKKKKELFEAHKKYCTEIIEYMINESTDNAANARLNNLLENVKNKPYNKETVLEDVIKIMEINEVLKN